MCSPDFRTLTLLMTEVQRHGTYAYFFRSYLFSKPRLKDEGDAINNCTRMAGTVAGKPRTLVLLPTVRIIPFHKFLPGGLECKVYLYILGMVPGI